MHKRGKGHRKGKCVCALEEGGEGRWGHMVDGDRAEKKRRQRREEFC